MYNYANNGVTVNSILDSRRTTSNGDYPIKIRVTFKRVRKYYSTGKTLNLENWNSLPDTKSKKLLATRTDIQNSFEKVKLTVQQLVYEDNFSFEALNKKLNRGSSTSTVNSIFTIRIENLKAEGKISTSEWYYYSLRSIILFAGENLTFNQITVDWLKKFEAFLFENGKSYTTISMYMRALQVIVNEAKSLGIIKEVNHPFGKGKYEIPQHEGRNIALTLADIAKIVHYECHNPTSEYYRDLWFFSYLCNGANMIDICRFKYSNTSNGELSFYRQKTLTRSKIKKEIVALITLEIQSIIDKWGNENKKMDSYIFPILQGGETPLGEKRKISNITRAVNQCMTKIGKELGIGKISTYTARHSYATVLKRSGANIAYISESLGHTDLKTTENYLASFEREEREKNAKLLTNFDTLKT